jgi:predicted RNase H-like nuclease (RuvC/YqgF family)
MQHKKATEIQKVFSKDKDPEDLSQQMKISRPLDPIQPYQQRSQDVSERWSEELRKADERAQNFRDQVEVLRKELQNLNAQNARLADKVAARETEIHRLSGAYRGDPTSGDRDAQEMDRQLEAAREQNEFLMSQLEDIGGVVRMR